MQPLIFDHPIMNVLALGKVLDLLGPLNIILFQEVFALFIEKVSEFL